MFRLNLLAGVLAATVSMIGAHAQSISQLPAASSTSAGDFIAATQGYTGLGTGVTRKITPQQIIDTMASADVARALGFQPLPAAAVGGTVAPLVGGLVPVGNIPPISALGGLLASNSLSDVSSPTAARANLGLGTLATQSAAAVNLTGGTVSGLLSLNTRLLNLTGNLPAAAPSPTGSWIYNTASIVGTTPLGATSIPYYFVNNDTARFSGQFGVNIMTVHDSIGAGFTGNRGGFTSIMSIGGSPDPSNTSNLSFQSGTFIANSGVSLLGTADNFLDSAGSLWGINPNVFINGSATHYLSMYDAESDLGVAAGASVVELSNFLITRSAPHAVRGVLTDDAITLALQAGVTASFGNGIQFGADSHGWPFAADSIGLLAVRPTAPVLGPVNVMDTFLDGRQASYTTAFVDGPNFGVDPTGKTYGNGLVTTGALQAQTGTVGSITLIARGGFTGGAYDLVPAIAIDPPPTGGTQATASVATMQAAYALASANGTGCVDGSTVTTAVPGGTAPTWTVHSTGGAANSLTLLTPGSVPSITANPVAISGGSCAGATAFAYYSIGSTIINNAGAGYPAFPPPMAYTSGYTSARDVSAKMLVNIVPASALLTLNGSGGAIKLGAGAFTANGSVATALSSVGPAGSHTTVQEWFTITDSAGTIRYIPAF